jgi:hypothetical protein
VVDTEITGIVTDVQKEVNRQLWGCGYGILGRWYSEGSDTNYYVQKLYRGNTTNGGDGFGSTFGAKYLDEINAAVNVEMGASSASAYTAFTVQTTDIAVSAIDYTTSSTYDALTNTDGGTAAAGSYWVRPASARSVAASSAAGYSRLEMMGLRGIVTNEDLDDVAIFDNAYGSGNRGLAVADPLQGLAVGTYNWWKAQVSTHSSGRYGGQRELTFELMDMMFDKVEVKAGKDYGPDMILTTHALRREYLNKCRADRRSVNTMTLDGGWKAIDFNGVPFTVDPDAIDGEVYFLTLKDLQIYRMSDYDWMTKDGAILSRISGYDAYEAVLFRYAELGCKRRNSHGVLCDLKYTRTTD